MKKTIIFLHNNKDLGNLFMYLHVIGCKWSSGRPIIIDSEIQRFNLSCSRSKSVAIIVDDGSLTYVSNKKDIVYSYISGDKFKYYDHYEYVDFDKEFDIDVTINGNKMGLL